jgi:hypothetical protein
MLSIEAESCWELAQFQVESIGWIRFEEGAYLHRASDESSDTTVIELVGLPKPEMQSASIFWLF